MPRNPGSRLRGSATESPSGVRLPESRRRGGEGLSTCGTAEYIGAAEPSPAERLSACADLLACPQCGHALTAPVADAAAADSPGRTLRCPHGHSFDLAKQGYVSLLTGASTKMTGDTPAMLDARAAFQSAGHFAPIAAALAATVATTLADTPDLVIESPTRPSTVRPDASRPTRPHSNAGLTHPGATTTRASAVRLSTTLLSGSATAVFEAAPVPAATRDSENRPPRPDSPAASVLEVGAGTGYYLAAVLDAIPEARGIALDVSKAAARRAARAHVRAGSVLADAWRGLPVCGDSVDAVLSVFAPRNAAEVARVLTARGRFFVVTPTPRHLGELIGPLGMVSVDAAKQDRLTESLGDRFEQIDQRLVEYSMSLSPAEVAEVTGMGPSAHHAAADRAELIAALPDPMAVTASVTVSTYRPR